MNIKVKIEVPRKLPTKQLYQFTDRTVYNIAALTLEKTEPHVPKRSQHMFNDIMARGVKGADRTYTLGVNDTQYAKYVWDMPKGTRWTNPKSYPQWFITEFKNEKEKIVNQAVNRAMRVIK